MVTTTTVASVESSQGKVGIVVVVVVLFALTTVSNVSDVTTVGGVDVELSVYVVNNAGGTVVTMSLPQKVTSARCTQSEPRARMNCRVSPRILPVLDSKLTRTRELQELLMELFWIIISRVLCCKTRMVCTPISHFGQLNITTSTLSTLMVMKFEGEVDARGICHYCE